jgi:hypothetical protein|tara:strand:- start:1138 stop:1791 length:654 start_codon:yes stop_codon:yes gene_type:complete
MRAQAEARRKLEAERNVSANNFLASNAITDDFRNDIFSQSDAARDFQLAGLDSSLAGTLQDIRQRNAGRGLSQSSSGAGLLGQAQGFANQSRQDLFDSARRRADQRIGDQQSFLDNAASSIRSGQSPISAQARFRTDIDSANNAFENALSKATGGDQRNAAFQNFENDRRLAAAKFKETVNQFGNQGNIAASSFRSNAKEDENNTGQVGGGFTGSLA